jgi:hypothetical protein
LSNIKYGRIATIFALSALTATVTGLTVCGARADDAAPAAPATPAAPAAPAAVTPPAPAIAVSGLLDFYYQYSFSKANGADIIGPSAGNALGLNAGGDYNNRQSTPTLALAEVNFSTAAAPGKFSGKATLITGDVAADNHAALTTSGIVSNRESRFENIQQLYATYTPETTGLVAGVDFGKFYTPFGYEVTESNANYNYTRSTVYNVLPVYHMGFRAYTPAKNGLTTTLYIVNALYNSTTEGVSSNNSSPAGIIQLNYADPKGKYTAIETFGAGTDRPAGTDVKNALSDTDFTYNLDANNLVGLNYTYWSSKTDGADTETTNGYAVYYRHQINVKDAVAFRVSGYDAKLDATKFQPYDITATYEIKAAANWLTRFEYRFDGSNIPTYLDSDGNFTKKNQSSLIASAVYTF